MTLAGIVVTPSVTRLSVGIRLVPAIAVYVLPESPEGLDGGAGLMEVAELQTLGTWFPTVVR
jgi:hypothetical protein